MAKTTELTVTEGKDEFYPTPDSLIEKMLDGIDYRMIGSVLEPSAGKGDLIKGFLHHRWQKLRYNSGDISVDAIEIDPYLRQICKYNFSREALKDSYDRQDFLRRMPYNEVTDSERKELSELEDFHRETDSYDNVRIVHDDFFTYRGWKQYDLILMNPPFSNGAMHLLKAIELQERGAQGKGGCCDCPSAYSHSQGRERHLGADEESRGGKGDA